MVFFDLSFLPARISLGIRSESGIDIAIITKENGYQIFDYNDGIITKTLDAGEAESFLRELRATGEFAARTSRARANEMYSIATDETGKPFVKADSQNIGTKDNPKEIVKALDEIVKNKFNDLVTANGQKIGIDEDTAGEWVYSRSAGHLYDKKRQTFADKANVFENADELLEVSRDYVGEATKHPRKDNIKEFARGKVDFKVGERGYEADIVVGITKSGAAYLHDIVRIKNKKIVEGTSKSAQDRSQDRRLNVSTIDDSIYDSKQNVNTETQNNFSSDVTEQVEQFARENVSGYDKLNEISKAAVRSTVRQAQARGLSESDTKLLARVAARSGLNIAVASRETMKTGKKYESGGDIYADGRFDADSGTIYLSETLSEGKKYSQILTHEMAHAVFGEQSAKGQSRLVLDAIKYSSQKTKDKAAIYAKLGISSAAMLEEIYTNHTEKVLGDSDVWEYILQKEPDTKEKVLGFLRRAAGRYAEVEGLSSEARRQLGKFKRMFDALAERGTNPLSVREYVRAEDEEKDALPEDVTLDDIKEIPVFYVSDDNDLEVALSNNPRKEKYKVLKDYILNQIGNEIITMSDGEKVIVDGSDAQHIAHKAGSHKTAKISKIKELVEKAVYYAYDDNVDHNKFDKFKYYYAKIVFKEDEYNAFLNVGRGKNDSKYHLYDITEKIRDNAHRLNGVGRLREFRPGNIVSDDKISQSSEKVNTEYKKSEKFALPDDVTAEETPDAKMITSDIVRAAFAGMTDKARAGLISDAVKYAKLSQLGADTSDPVKFFDENARAVLGDQDFWEYVLYKDPAAEKKVLTYLRRAAARYDGISGISEDVKKRLEKLETIFADIKADEDAGERTAPSAYIRGRAIWRRSLPERRDLLWRRSNVQ